MSGDYIKKKPEQKVLVVPQLPDVATFSNPGRKIEFKDLKSDKK